MCVCVLFRGALDAYTSDEIMRWPLPNEAAWKSALTGLPTATAGKEALAAVQSSTAALFSASSSAASASATPAGDADADADVSLQAKRFVDLHKRVVQHNLRVIALYYTRITTKRLSELLQLEQNTAEKYLCEMVSDKQLTAKVDRPQGIIDFQPNKQHSATIQAWTKDVNELLSTVDNTNHLIAKEFMTYKLK